MLKIKHKKTLLGIMSACVMGVIILLIRIYQKTLSYDHGPLKALYPYGFCPFYPTCSEYGIAAVKKHGVLFGTIKTIGRVVRCHPCTKGGIDHP